MEEVYEKKRFRLLYTKKVDLNKYFSKYSQDLLGLYRMGRKGEHLKTLLGIDSDEQLEELKRRMDPKKGKTNYVPKSFIPRRRFLRSWAFYDLPPFQTQLVTLDNLKKDTTDEKYKRIKTMGYFGKIILDVEREVEDSMRCKSLCPLWDFVVCVRVHSMIENVGQSKYRPSQELWVPGRMTLDRLKDRIICSEDFQFVDPTVQRPDEINSKRKMEVNKYGMFYLGNNFYVDKRWGEEAVHDYSREVRKWMEERGMDSGSVESMNTTCIRDVPVRLGYHYLYLHQGKCEHLITFTDARLVKPTDLLIYECYPLLQSFASVKGRICVLCLNRSAKLCVMDCDLIPYDKAFVCHMCALSFLFDKDGNKKSQFTLYKYVDRSAII